MPSSEVVIKALEQIRKRAANYEYFFDQLDSPDWIVPLLAEGFFKHPPAPQKEGDSVGFPFWPESRYLAKMASRDPDLVLNVALNVPDTDNVRIHEDFAEAALAMPPHLSAALAKKETGWIERQNHLFFVLPRTLGKLISHLARGGEVDAALDLARALLEVLPDQKAKEKTKKDEDDLFSLPPQPSVRFDQWEYEEILKKNVPDLVTAADARGIELLCDLLEAAVRYSQSDGAKGAPWDYSWIWRPAIEDHFQNRHRGLRSILVTSLRDACESLIREGKEGVKALVGFLESNKYPWHIFRRIALHLLRLFPESTANLIAQRLTDFNVFDTHAFRHEYAMLLRDCFKFLSDNQQKIILGWIEQGPPDLEEYKNSRDETTGKYPTKEDARRFQKGWQRVRLAWFSDALPEEWKKRYQELVAEFGEPDHPEFPSYSTGTWVGPTSPKSADELEAMTVSEVTAFLKTWDPPGESMAPSPEGLGRVLSSVVSEKPDRFSAEATTFEGLDPTYVRALLVGFRDAINKGKTFAWQPVLDLCKWVVQQPRNIDDEKSVDMDKDPHWGWARKTIADLFSSGFKEGKRCIPFKFQELVWATLQPLTEDPEPTPEYEKEYGGTNMDPTSLSINTTRGEAMHALVRYALWVRHYLENESDGKERPDRGFEEMPEVREILNAHLDIERDPSLAIRSVYGQWFPWLVLIDSKWAAKKAGDIFPSEEKERPFWDAAWNAYVFRCQAYDNVFDVLEDQYALAIDRSIEPTKDEDSFENPQRNLGEHLMVFYWRGKLNISEPESLLGRFWKKASPFVRGKALVFVGRNLQDTEGEVEAKTLDRMKKLWESRLEEAKSAQDAAVFVSEMEAFGWWFASGKFDDKWAIEQLLEALRLVQKTDPTHLVVDRLAEVSEKFPFEAVQCLGLLAKGDREGWKIHGWIEEAKTILSSAMKSGGKATESAEDLIHYLGSRGYLQFRSLPQRD